MTRPFVYVKVSPTKYTVCRRGGDYIYQYGSIELSPFKEWIFVPDTGDTPFLMGYELIRIGKKILSLNKAKANA